jgi:predicted nucleic acid-binding protein
MSNVVLDASFLVKLLVEEPGSRLGKATFEAYEHAGTAFLVPGHAYAEVLEVIRRKFNKGMVTPVQMRRAAKILPTLANAVPLSGLLVSGYSVALDLGITIYDALYVALADRGSSILLTSDIKLVERLRNTPYEDLAIGVGETGLVYYGTR